MGKWVLSRGIPGLTVALGVTALIVLLLWGGGGSGLAQETTDLFLPLVMKEYPTPSPASLEDHFDTNADNWTPFLNQGRLSPEQWYWEAGTGYAGGGYRHNRYGGGKEAEDALSMYLEGDSQTWTDYSFQARVIIRAGARAGLWFRGTYPENDDRAGNVTGYYFMLSGSGAYLLQMQTLDDCIYPACDRPWYLWDFDNPRSLASVSMTIDKSQWHTLKVEVQGARIKCYLDGELLIDYDDSPIP
ncbi:MAG: family 16 glycoside hydrolase, partial [Anaerolineae bacterium]